MCSQIQWRILWIHLIRSMLLRQIEALYKQKKPYWFVSALIYWFMTKSDHWTWTGGLSMHLLHIMQFEQWHWYWINTLSAWCSYRIKVQIREILIWSRKYQFRKVELFKHLQEVFFTSCLLLLHLSSILQGSVCFSAADTENLLLSLLRLLWWLWH